MSNKDSIEIYRVRLDRSESEWPAFSSLLNPAERERAAKFLAESKRREFTITRATLRILLSHALQEEPAHIRISHEAQGKPRIEDPQQHSRIRFSVSHSHDLALIAIARDRDIGVDVEKIRPEVEIDQLAERFFSGVESAALRQYSDTDRLRAFFMVWTRKEAIVKAQGGGIALGLKQFDVSVDPDATPLVTATRWKQTGIPEWTLFNLEAGPDYAASLAVSGRDTAEIRLLEGPVP
jgi:4'-phosphopantetheinyl transferase